MCPASLPNLFLHSMKNEDTSNAILKDMRNYLSALPFNFQNASIISGQEEGLYGWITVNYLMGNFLEVSSWAALLNLFLFWSLTSDDMINDFDDITLHFSFSSVQSNALYNMKCPDPYF